MSVISDGREGNAPGGLPGKQTEEDGRKPDGEIRTSGFDEGGLEKTRLVSEKRLRGITNRKMSLVGGAPVLYSTGFPTGARRARPRDHFLGGRLDHEGAKG